MKSFFSLRTPRRMQRVEWMDGWMEWLFCVNVMTDWLTQWLSEGQVRPREKTAVTRTISEREADLRNHRQRLKESLIRKMSKVPCSEKSRIPSLLSYPVKRVGQSSDGKSKSTSREKWLDWVTEGVSEWVSEWPKEENFSQVHLSGTRKFCGQLFLFFWGTISTCGRLSTLF